MHVMVLPVGNKRGMLYENCERDELRREQDATRTSKACETLRLVHAIGRGCCRCRRCFVLCRAGIHVMVWRVPLAAVTAAFRTAIALRQLPTALEVPVGCVTVSPRPSSPPPFLTPVADA